MNAPLSETPVIPYPKPVRQKHRSRRERRELRKVSPLDHMLHVSGISPIKIKSVKKYQSAKLEELKKPQLVFEETREAGKTIWIFAAFVCAAILPFVILCFATFYAENNHLGMAIAVLTIAGNLWFIRLAQVGKKVTKAVFHRKHLLAKWETAPYELFASRRVAPALPIEVRTIAGEIQARLPKAELEVEYLYEDPFLKVTHKDPASGKTETRYVAFWDETGFIA